MKKRKTLMIDIGITRCCNMRCEFCRATATHSFENMMTFEQFKKIIDKIEELIKDKKIILSPKYISYGAVGEPLINSDFIKMNEYVKKHGWKTGFYTNGVLLTKEKIHEIYLNGGVDTINVSITGVESKVFKNFQGYGFKDADRDKILNKILDNIKYLVQYRNHEKKKTKIAVNYIITKENISHIIPYIRYMAKIGVDEIRFTPLVDRPRKKKKIKVACSRFCHFLEIDVNGDLSGCSNDMVKDFVIGNIMEENWLEAYDQIMCDMNNAKFDRLPIPCQVCDKVNFSSFWDYLSMNFHGYLEFENHKILWVKSIMRYAKDMSGRIRWYFCNRYV